MVEFSGKVYPQISEMFRMYLYKKVRYTSLYIINSVFDSLRKRTLRQKKITKDAIDGEFWLINTFLTFSNKGYKHPRRILNQAIETGWFKHVKYVNETRMKNLTLDQQEFCRARKHEGYGLWIWKPLIIESQLELMNENETLLYCDSGMYLNSGGYKYLSKYLANMENNSEDAIFFSINSTNKSSRIYTEIHQFNQELLYNLELSYSGEFDPQIYAGLMVLKNTENTRNFIGQWKELCLNVALLSQTRDADNGLLNFSNSPMLKFTIYPGNQVNIYDQSGMQKKHVLSPKKYKELDWSELSEYPFQYRRIK